MTDHPLAQAEMADNVGAIRQWVTMLAKLMPGSANETYARFMLERGRAYPVTANTFAGPRKTPKECFANAGRMAICRDGLTYVEGYVTTMGIPISHAWLVNAAGEAIDPTLRTDDVPSRGYFGLAFHTEYLRRTVLKSGYWGLLDGNSATVRAIVEGKTEGMLLNAAGLPLSNDRQRRFTGATRRER